MHYPTPRLALASIALAATASLTLVAAPAWADEKQAADYCWQNLDTGVTQCFVDEATLNATIVAETHSVLAAPGVLARGSSALLTTYTLATWYEDANYLGAFTKSTSTNSALCAGVGSAANFTSGWDNRVSSFKAWYGCAGTLYSGTGQTGSSYGLYTSAPTVGALNDAASSWRLS